MLSLLEPEVYLFQLTAPLLSLLINADKSVVIDHCLKRDKNVSCQFDGCCIFDRRQWQFLAPDVLEQDFVLVLHGVEVGVGIAIPMHSELLGVGEDALKSKGDPH